MQTRKMLVGASFITLLGAWLAVRGRPWLAALAFVCAAASISVAVLPVRRRRTRGAAVLFTDIVDSTSLIALVGDAKWAETLRRYEHATREAAAAEQAAVTKPLGDGFLVVFVGPFATRSVVACAMKVRRSAREESLETRAAVHTGECLLSRGDATGLAVHIAARVMATATPGDVVMTAAAYDALHDVGLPVEDAGTHELRGIPEPQKLYRVVG